MTVTNRFPKKNSLQQHYAALLRCRRCPEMVGPVVSGKPVASRVILIGQAPGAKEGTFGKPFAWTAGKTLFRWFDSIGIDEETFRDKIYMAAVCRCFPGKGSQGGDRVPAKNEIKNCSHWLEAEFELLKPELVIPVGKLAITQVLPEARELQGIIGKKFHAQCFGQKVDVIALPHPSGASPWHRIEPGKSLLKKALQLIERHSSFQKSFR